MAVNSDSAKIDWQHHGHTLVVYIGGDWRLQTDRPSLAPLLDDLYQTDPRQFKIVAHELGRWDSSLLSTLYQILIRCRKQKIEIDLDQLPEGIQRLLKLSQATPQTRNGRREFHQAPFLAKIGEATLELHRTWKDGLAFIGEAVLCSGTVLRGKARFRLADLLQLLEDCGAQALPIVTLISVLVGMTLAFVGAAQLRLFGAGVFVADLVGLGMAREMGAMMTAVIMAGRTGAAFAAQLGTMQVNEEIDALQTLGIPPMDFLVAPRMIALTLMLPLLAIYSIFLGIFGGGLVSALMLDISVQTYFLRIQEAVGLTHFIIGFSKAVVFGVIVALSGCLRGLQCGRSAQAVGQATTSAVVTSIVLIVIADAIITIICQLLGV